MAPLDSRLRGHDVVGGTMKSLTTLLTLLTLGIAACNSDANVAPRCEQDMQCTTGQTCVDGACVLQTSSSNTCDARIACPDGEFCCGNRCSAEACCTVDNECGLGFCDNGICMDGLRPACNETVACPTGRCVLASGRCVECIFDDDCPIPGLACVNNRCDQPPTGCTAAECGAQGLICDNDGSCRACQSNLECGTQVCANGACTACVADNQCGAGEECDNGNCVNATGTLCGSNTDCGTQVCKRVSGQNQCQPCLFDEECGANRSCASGACTVLVPGGCTNDNACDPPTTVCQAGVCDPGCTGANDCAQGELCNLNTGRCVPSGGNGTAALGDTCVDPLDCASNVCWPVTLNSPAFQGRLCTQTCNRHDDCPEDFVCFETGAAKLCLAESRFGQGNLDLLPGATCQNNAQGQNACVTSYCEPLATAAAPVCLQTCGQDGDCSDVPTTDCVGARPYGDHPFEVDGYTQVCLPPVGSQAPHTLCSWWGEPQNDECASGFCANYPNLYELPRCAEFCCTPSDCGSSQATVCKPLAVHDGYYNSSSEPFAFHKICMPNEFSGTKGLGEECTVDQECQSEICVEGTSGTKRCTQTCCTPDDCSGFTWAESCRPPFLGIDAHYGAVTESLGRIGVTPVALTPFIANAVGSICYPR